jgi:hypothetical protein
MPATATDKATIFLIMRNLQILKYDMPPMARRALGVQSAALRTAT